MSIRFTLIGILGILTAIVASASYGSLYYLKDLNRNAIKYTTETVPLTEVIGHLSVDMGHFRYAEAEHIFTQDRKKILEKEVILDGMLPEIRKHLQVYETLSAKAEDESAYQALVEGWRRYLELHPIIMDLSRVQRDDEAAVVYEGAMGVIFGEIAQILDDALARQQVTANQQGAAGLREYEAARLALLIGLVLCMVVCCCATAYAVWGVSSPLTTLTGAMERLADGAFDMELPGLGRGDEIGKIANAVRRFKIKTAERAEALETARKAAEVAGAAKANFIASMSHEIRTPLNGVLGMAQALCGDELTADQREKVDIILDSGTTLTALLNDVLDMSKIDAGKMEIAPIDGDLRSPIMRVAQLFRPSANDKGILLSVFLDSAIPERINFDPVRLRQCVGNLLSNAIKFTPHGGKADVRVTCVPHAEGANLVTLTITDTGIGMAQDTVDKLFSAFTQADGSISRRFGGSGLGLAISRRLAQAMGGDITVQSEVGFGSSFIMTFLAADASAELSTLKSLEEDKIVQPSSPAVLHGSHILIVDDNAVNRQVAKLFLKPYDVRITEAGNGREALDALEKAAFDIVLLDVHMPVMDGVETIKAIRASKAAWSGIPTIALTADAMSGDRERYLAIGMTDYLSKPIDQSEMIGKLMAIMAQQRVHVTAMPGDAAPAQSERVRRAAG